MIEGLKQKIQELLEAEEENYATAKAMAKCTEREELLAHSWGRMKAFKWFSQQLDEATKTINQIMCEDYWTSNFHLNKVRRKILAALEGVERE